MKLYNYLACAFLFGCSLNVQALENDTLFVQTDTLGTQYTLQLSDAQLKDPVDSYGILVRRPFGNNSRGAFVEFYKDRVVANGTIVANFLTDGDDKHDYLIIRNSAGMNLYRDGILLATIPETVSLSMKTSHSDQKYEYTVVGCSGLEDGYSASVISGTESSVIDESIFEDNISNMLPMSSRNLVGDPYMNHGFLNSGLNAKSRFFYSNAASWDGWGADASIVTEGAYSGATCVKIFGQAFGNGTATTGASLDLPLTLNSGISYMVRAMVKSEGFVGKIAIEGERGYIPLTDTHGEWVQVEGILTCTSSRSKLYINNYDFVNSGTLYIDNVEVYRGYTPTTATAGVVDVPYLEIPASSKYKSSVSRSLYMAGFQLGTKCSELDITNLNYSGAARLTNTVEGSKLYPLYFPGDLKVVTVTGSYDGNSYSDQPLFNGVDYILQKYKYPQFEYCSVDEPISAGTYLIQFVDNLDGLKVSMTTGVAKDCISEETAYRMVGNSTYAKYTPEGRFLKFDEAAQCFKLVEGAAVNPFEAYIETASPTPVSTIYPHWVTDFKRVYSNEGVRLSLYTTEGGVTVNASENATVNVLTLEGRVVAVWQLNEGENYFSLPLGIYFVGGNKVVVDR